MAYRRFLAKIKTEYLLIWVGVILMGVIALIAYQDYSARKKIDKDLELAESIVQEVAISFNEADLAEEVQVTDEYLRSRSDRIERIIITPKREIAVYFKEDVVNSKENSIVMHYLSIDDLRRSRFTCLEGNLRERIRPFHCRK